MLQTAAQNFNLQVIDLLTNSIIPTNIKTGSLGYTPSGYQIFKDAGLSQLVATIPFQPPLSYKDYAITAAPQTYYLIAYDVNGNRSPALSTVVP